MPSFDILNGKFDELQALRAEDGSDLVSIMKELNLLRVQLNELMFGDVAVEERLKVSTLLSSVDAVREDLNITLGEMDLSIPDKLAIQLEYAEQKVENPEYFELTAIMSEFHEFEEEFILEDAEGADLVHSKVFLEGLLKRLDEQTGLLEAKVAAEKDAVSPTHLAGLHKAPESDNQKLLKSVGGEREKLSELYDSVCARLDGGPCADR